MRKLLGIHWDQLITRDKDQDLSKFKRFQSKMKFYHGDASQTLSRFMEKSTVDFFYMDPTWFSFHKSGFKIKKSWSIEGCNKEGEFIDLIKDKFSDDPMGYLAWFIPLIRQMKFKMKSSGVIAIHLSSDIAPYFRVTLDQEVFGSNNFVNEIIWGYRSGGAGKGRCAQKHDTILIYAKDKSKCYFNNDIKDYTTSSKVKPVDWWTDICGKSGTETGYLHSNYSEDINGGCSNFKPLNLMVKLINLYCPPGGVVCDLFQGSGTSAIATYMSNLSQEPLQITGQGDDQIVEPVLEDISSIGINRQYIGGDLEIESMKELASKFKKLWSLKFNLEAKQLISTSDESSRTTASFKLSELLSYDDNHIIAEVIISELMGGMPNPKKSGDDGVDGWTLKGHPIQVKLSDKIGSPQVRNFFGTEDVAKYKSGYFIAYSFSKAAIDHAKRMRKRGVEVHLWVIDRSQDSLKVSEVYPRKKELTSLKAA